MTTISSDILLTKKFWIFVHSYCTTERYIVCLGFFVPLETVSPIWIRHHYHTLTLNNCHLRGPVTITPVAERLAMEPSLPVLTTSKSVPTGDRTRV